MSEDWKEEMKKLREELANMKEQLHDMSEKAGRRRRGIYIDIGEKVGNYVQDVMEGVAEGISGELERSVFVGPRGVRVYKGRWKPEKIRADPKKAASAMRALGHEHRLRILRELMHGGKYISELQEKLSEITSSTLSSHLDILQEVGLVVQEKVRGRYLITIPGRMAYKMANRIAKLVEGS